MCEIKRVPEEVCGMKDTAIIEAKCALFNSESDITAHLILDCTMLVSWDNGVVSINFSEDGTRKTVTVRLDELLAVLREAKNSFLDRIGQQADEQTLSPAT